IGYREVIDYLEGKYDFDKMVHLIKRNTRHFARRQIIWFKRYKEAVWYNLTFEDVGEVKEKLKKLIVENFSV
ncbi:MAG: tRNA delta(2)-isopentenylpyrophosphate transferase, partial [Thermotoga sp.]|nr:tRNA delta(2)-isopentenylpyrophosphate transferase [Thermotoga sp.]